MPRLLVRAAVHRDPLGRELLLLFVLRELLGTRPQVLFARYPQIGTEPAMRFGGDVSCRRNVGVGVKEDPSFFRFHQAALRRWCGMHERSSCRVGEERLRDRRPPLLVGFSALYLSGLPL